MKRSIITFDEKRCTGCGQCIPDCPEGAVSVVEGEAAPYDEKAGDGDHCRAGAPVVPCCGGVRYIVDKALEMAKKNIPVDEKTITILGGIG